MAGLILRRLDNNEELSVDYFFKPQAVPPGCVGAEPPSLVFISPAAFTVKLITTLSNAKPLFEVLLRSHDIVYAVHESPLDIKTPE
jgi:hypothetical protein